MHQDKVTETDSKRDWGFNLDVWLCAAVSVRMPYWQASSRSILSHEKAVIRELMFIYSLTNIWGLD